MLAIILMQVLNRKYLYLLLLGSYTCYGARGGVMVKALRY